MIYVRTGQMVCMQERQKHGRWLSLLMQGNKIILNEKTC